MTPAVAFQRAVDFAINRDVLMPGTVPDVPGAMIAKMPTADREALHAVTAADTWDVRQDTLRAWCPNLKWRG